NYAISTELGTFSDLAVVPDAGPITNLCLIRNVCTGMDTDRHMNLLIISVNKISIFFLIIALRIKACLELVSISKTHRLLSLDSNISLSIPPDQVKCWSLNKIRFPLD